MNKMSWIRGVCFICVLAVIAVGCGSGDGDEAAGDAAFETIRQQQAALGAKRLEAAGLAEQIAAALAAPMDEAEGEGEESAVVGPSVEDLEADLKQVEGEIDAMSEELMNSLVAHLNAAGMVEGEAPTGTVLEAIRMKTSEDMIIAQEYIDKGGEYRRAMDILATSAMLDPDNPELKARQEQYDADQFMTEERFGMATKGMTQADVQKRLGTVMRGNAREYPDKNIVAWFYRKADKGAAAVYFDEKDGVMTVYKVDFEAVKAGEEAE